MLGLLQNGDRQIARDSRESLEKILYSVASFEVFEECLHWHSCSAEYGDAMHGLRVSRDRCFHSAIVSHRDCVSRRFRKTLLTPTSLYSLPLFARPPERGGVAPDWLDQKQFSK
jgi:hypothetical protein